jgi:hypothetical protein
MKHLLVAAMTSLAGFTTSAAAGGAVPPRALAEPGSFELLAIAGVVAVVIALRNRRK